MGPISKKNKLASNTSYLAAAWHGREGCNNCPNNLLLVYQDTMGNLQLGNATIGVGWRWDQLQAHPLPGTGISLALFWWPNAPIELRLFYQNQDLSLCSLNWGTSNSSTGTGGFMSFHFYTTATKLALLQVCGLWRKAHP